MFLKKLGISTLVYGMGGVLNRAVALLLLPFLTQYLDQKAYGVATLLQLIGFFAIPVFSLGIGSSLSACYFKYDGDANRRAVVMSAVMLMGVSAAVLLFLFLPTANWLAEIYFGDSALASVVEMSAITNALILVCQPLVLQIQFEGKSRTFVLLSALTSLSTSGIIISAVAGLKFGLAGWIGGQMLGQILSLLVYSAYFVQSGGGRIQWRFLRELVRTGIPMVPSFLFIYIIMQGNRIFVEQYMGLEQLGVFSVASSMAAAVSLVVTAFQNAWTPFFMGYRDNINRARSVFGEVTSLYLLGMGACAVSFFCFAQPMMALMTEKSFHGGWIAIGGVATAFILTGATNLLAPAQYFSGKIWHLSVIQGLAATCSVCLNWWLVRSGGLLGAGSSLAASFLVLFVIHAFWNRMEWSMALPVDYDWKRILTVWFSVVAVAAITLSFPASSVVSGLIQGCALNLLFLAGIWIILYERERAWILRFLKRWLARSEKS
jgi:O-antigen/teichoic acid export membrane protein